ncbi:hypothetical protein ACNF49_30840 [Actinomadura sp. ATCC 39365]
MPEREGQSPAATAGTGQAAGRGGPGELLRVLLAGERPGAAVTLERLHRDTHLIIVDGQRAGWADHDGATWRVHGDAGATHLVEGDLAQALADGLRTTVSTEGVRDHLGRLLELNPDSLASWSLLRGRVLGREDVIVRGRCVGWLQKNRAGRYVACTHRGPIEGPAGTSKVQTIMALFAALYAPAPLPALPAAARAVRRAKARSENERPICPFTQAQPAAAALNPPRHDGGYQVVVDDYGDQAVLGRVRRTTIGRAGTRWQAFTPDGRAVAHAGTRTAAIDAMLATPGPLFGDPAGTVLHDLTHLTAGVIGGTR